jgi:hypothetical protein
MQCSPMADTGMSMTASLLRQCRLLAGAELLGIGELQEVVVFLLGEPLPSALDGALDASVVALDGSPRSTSSLDHRARDRCCFSVTTGSARSV